MEILNWPIDSQLKQETEKHYRTRFAQSLKDKDPLTTIRLMTFDGVVPKIEIQDLENLIDFVEKNFLKKKIKGIGVEVGSGPATFSPVLAKRGLVQKIYAVEVCESIVRLLMPKVVRYILDDNEQKVSGVMGSFDDMRLPSESVDFIFDFFSLHHSSDLSRTLKECHRILKKDGFIFCFDKARPDYFTSQDLDELLDKECFEEEKKVLDDPDRIISRRMLGEREFRLRDWKSYLLGAGFQKIESFNLSKLNQRFIKKLIAAIPARIQSRINKLLPKSKFNHKFILDQRNKVYSKLVNPFPKDISLLIAY